MTSPATSTTAPMLFDKEVKGYRLKAVFSDDLMKLFLSIEGVEAGGEKAKEEDGQKEQKAEGGQEEKKKKEAKPREMLLLDDVLPLLKEYASFENYHLDVVKDALEQIKKGHLPVEPRRIAKGREAESGRDGKVVYLLRVYDRKNGSVPKVPGFEPAWIELDGFRMVDVVEAGATIARIYPPTAGVPGADAIGRPLAPTPGKPVDIQVDASLTIKSPEQKNSFQTIVAQMPGYVENIEGTLCVFQELRLKGVLGIETGSIRFNGKVAVEGDVASGIFLSGPTGIEVKGTVDGASLQTEKGQILIDGNLIGSQKSKIHGAELVRVKRGQTAEIDCGGDVVFDDYLANCLIRSRGAVFSERGNLSGGISFCVSGVQVKELGNEQGLKTVIVLCSAIETTQEFTELIQRISDHERAIQVLEMHLAHFAKLPERIQLLAPAHREKMSKLYEKLVALRTSYEILKKKKTAFLEQVPEAAVPPVSVQSKAHAGLEIHARDTHWSLTETVDGPCSFVFDEEKKLFQKAPLVAVVLREIAGNADKK